MKENSETTASMNVAFKASNGKYVSASGGDGSPLLANKDAIGATETFQMIHQEDKKMVLKAANGKYVSNPADGGQPLIANAAAIGASEIFEVADWGQYKVALFASNLKYVSLTANAELQATKPDVTKADTFTIDLISADGKSISPRLAAERTAKPAASKKAKTAAAKVGASGADAFTVCFSGTACTRDEGEVTREGSDKKIYCDETGYIPVRIHKEISGSLKATSPSVSVRGVGENDWAVPRDNSEPLVFNAPLNAERSLLRYVSSYSGGNQYSTATQIDGWSAPALALHGANLAAASGAKKFNFIGHSRGAVEAIMAAWFIYAYGADEVKNIPINIFGIDPVPGKGEWYGIFTQLPPNVVNYVGVYSWDQVGQALDPGFMALVPRPNGRMTGKSNNAKIYHSWWWNSWKYLADEAQLTDPLKKGSSAQPVGFELYACRGRHGTVAGNTTADGAYDPKNVSETVAPVPELIYKMARAYLTKWGTTFPTDSAVAEDVLPLRKSINTNHRDFDAMGGGETRNSILPDRPYVRRVSSISGLNPYNTYFMDNVVGDPPYKMAYPVTKDRTDAGWVKWKFL